MIAARACVLGSLASLMAASGCGPAIGARPVTVWAADMRQQVEPSTRGPAADDAIYDAERGSLNLQAAVNETVCFQVVIHSGLTSLADVNIELGDLRSDKGHTLRAEAKVFRAWPVRVEAFHPWQRLYRQDECQPREVYDVLVPADTPEYGLPVTLPPDTMALAWVDLHIEKGSEPGVYAGTVRVTSKGQPLWTMNASLEVHPFALPDAPALRAITRFDGRDLCRSHLRLAGKAYAPVRLSQHDPLVDQAIDLIHATAELLNAHGVTGVPAGYGPALHVDADGNLQVRWQDYDRLVQPLLDGEFSSGRVRPDAWPVPLEAGDIPLPGRGTGSTGLYQRLLSQYARQAAEHFRLRRWHDQAFFEVDVPGTWPDDYARWQQLIVPTLAQAAPTLRRLVRLPDAQMGAYGWFGWPDTHRLTARADILSVPGRFFVYSDAPPQPDRQRWLRPDHPPFCPSLRLGAGGIDPGALPWAAWRLRADAIDLPDQGGWPDSRDIVVDRPDADGDGWLVWPGQPWGLDAPVPSIRLKRLRAGLQECKYLYLLRQHGRVHVDELLAESLVPLAGSLAYGRQLIEGLGGEIQTDKTAWDDGLHLMAEEVRMAIADVGSDEFDQFTNRIDWRTFLQKARRVRAWAEPVRLRADAAGLIRAQIPIEILNLRAVPVSGKVRWGPLPDLWKAAGESIDFGPVQPFQRTRVVLSAEGPGLGTDTTGHSPWTIVFEPDGEDPTEITAVLSAVAAMQLDEPITVDGDLTDWKPGRFNTLSRFRTFGRSDDRPGDPNEPVPSGTDAFVASDGETLYIAARMHGAAQDLRLKQTNTVAYDGAVPVGEDLIEILLDPDNGASGGPERLIHVIVKANGAAVANLGLDLDPPLGPHRPLGTQVQAAARIHKDAWTAEVAIPLRALRPIRPKPAYWGLNICRMRAADLEYTNWSGARVSSYHPEALGNLLVPNQPLPAAADPP